MEKSRFCALVLALVMLFCTLPATAAATAPPLLGKIRTAPSFTDVKGTPYETAARTVYETTLMEAGEKNLFKPEGTLKTAQVIAICARLHEFLTGGDGELPPPAKGKPWYQPFYDYLAGAQNSGSSLMQTYPASEVCRRSDFADLLDLTLHAANVTLPVLNTITALQDTSDSRVLTLYNAGILKGVGPYGAFMGTDVLTRGEAAAMLARVIDPAQRLTFTLTPFDVYEELGVKPEDVLFHINGEDVTAQQGIYLLAQEITSVWGSDYSFATAEAYTLNSFQKVFAVRILAEQRGISLTQEELDYAAQQARRTAGYQGASAESWQWYIEGFLLKQAVKASYIKEFGMNNAHGVSDQFSVALAQTASSIALERTPATASKNLGAFRVKLIASPFYDFQGRFVWEA